MDIENLLLKTSDGWEPAYNAALREAVESLMAAGKKPYYFYVVGEDEHGAPTHWYPGDPDDEDRAFGPVIPMEDGLADTGAWERENPGYFELLGLMDEIHDRVKEDWGGMPPE